MDVTAAGKEGKDHRQMTNAWCASIATQDGSVTNKSNDIASEAVPVLQALAIMES
jgi:hypothetical protein